MEVAKLAAPPNLEVRFVSCNESAIKRWLSSELEETVFSLTHELFMSKHHTVTLSVLCTSVIWNNNWNFILTHNVNLLEVVIDASALKHVYPVQNYAIVTVKSSH